MSRLTDLMFQGNPEKNNQSEDPTKNLEYQSQRIQSDEKIIKSYGASPGIIPSQEADKLIARGLAKKGERVCWRCFAITITEYTKCSKCKHEQYLAYKHCRTMKGM